VCMQLGCSFFQGMAAEFAAQDYGRPTLEQWFRPLQTHAQTEAEARDTVPHLLQRAAGPSHAARAVLIDMEPKASRAPAALRCAACALCASRPRRVEGWGSGALVTALSAHRQCCVSAVPGLCQCCVSTVSVLCQCCVSAVLELCQRCASAVSVLCQCCVSAVSVLC